MDTRTNRSLDLNLALLRKVKPHAAPGHVLDNESVPLACSRAAP